MSKIKNGQLVSKKVTQKNFPKLERGSLLKINAIIIHQTGAATAKQTFNSYEKGGHGAHFLIDENGDIHQTASLLKITFHIGKIRSKCYESKNCSKEELKAATDILFQKDKSYPNRVKDLHHHEKDKEYPARYPTNNDSVGIEIVGSFNKSKKEYDSVSESQNNSLKWLLGELYSHYAITKLNVYRHPEVSYKQPTEGKTANW